MQYWIKELTRSLHNRFVSSGRLIHGECSVFQFRVFWQACSIKTGHMSHRGSTFTFESHRTFSVLRRYDAGDSSSWKSLRLYGWIGAEV